VVQEASREVENLVAETVVVEIDIAFVQKGGNVALQGIGERARFREKSQVGSRPFFPLLSLPIRREKGVENMLWGSTSFISASAKLSRSGPSGTYMPAGAHSPSEEGQEDYRMGDKARGEGRRGHIAGNRDRTDLATLSRLF
jgi:hypothetical protein